MAEGTATAEAKEEKQIVLTIDGEEITVTGRTASTLENLVEAKKEETYAKDRGKFSTAAAKGINAILDGMSETELEAVKGMSVVFSVDGDEPQLVETSKVTIRQRASKKAAA
tara:strand:+ start:2173 stop:2508 length:336 start_codon:yes stop_codon:yes gene_type:complete